MFVFRVLFKDQEKSKLHIERAFRLSLNYNIAISSLTGNLIVKIINIDYVKTLKLNKTVASTRVLRIFIYYRFCVGCSH